MEENVCRHGWGGGYIKYPTCVDSSSVQTAPSVLSARTAVAPVWVTSDLLDLWRVEARGRGSVGVAWLAEQRTELWEAVGRAMETIVCEHVWVYLPVKNRQQKVYILSNFPALPKIIGFPPPPNTYSKGSCILIGFMGVFLQHWRTLILFSLHQQLTPECSARFWKQKHF